MMKIETRRSEWNHWEGHSKHMGNMKSVPIKPNYHEIHQIKICSLFITSSHTKKKELKSIQL